MSRRRLEIGEDNIAESHPWKNRKDRQKTVNGREVEKTKVYYELQWFINLDGTVTRRCTRTVAVTRANARSSPRER